MSMKSSMREIEVKVLESINEDCALKKVNTLIMNSEDFAVLNSDELRATDVLETLQACLQRNVYIAVSNNLKPGQMQWVVGKKKEPLSTSKLQLIDNKGNK
jgi:predicted membrane chloride channel (bestrophin family)